MSALPIVYIKSHAPELIDAIEISCTFANMEGSTEPGERFVAAAIVDARGLKNLEAVCESIGERIANAPIVLLFDDQKNFRTDLAELNFALPLAASTLFESLAAALNWPLPNIPASLFLGDNNDEVPAPPPMLADEIKSAAQAKNEADAIAKITKSGRVLRPLSARVARMRKRSLQLRVGADDEAPQKRQSTSDVTLEPTLDVGPTLAPTLDALDDELEREFFIEEPTLEVEAMTLPSAARPSMASFEHEDSDEDATREVVRQKAAAPHASTQEDALEVKSLRQKLEVQQANELRLEKQSAALEDRLKAFEDERAQLKAQNAKLNADLDSLRADLDDLKIERDAFAAREKAATEERDAFLQERSRQNDEGKGLAEEVQKISALYEDEKRKVSELEKEWESFSGEFDANLEKITKERDAFRLEANQLYAAQDEVAQLRESLAQSQRRLNSLEARAELAFELEEKLESTRAKTRELDDALTLAQMARDDAEKEAAMLRSEHSESSEKSRGESESLKRALRDAEESSERQARVFDEKINVRDDQIASLQKDIAARDEMFEALNVQMRQERDTHREQKRNLETRLSDSFETLRKAEEEAQLRAEAMTVERNALTRQKDELALDWQSAKEQHLEELQTLRALHVKASAEREEQFEQSLQRERDENERHEREWRARAEEDFERRRHEDAEERLNAQRRYREELEVSLRDEIESRVAREHQEKRRLLEEEMQIREESAKAAAAADKLERERWKREEEERLAKERETIEEQKRENERRTRERLSFKSGLLDAMLVTDAHQAYHGDASVLEWEEGIRQNMPQGGSRFALDGESPIDTQAPLLELVPLTPLEGTFSSGELPALLWAAHSLGVSGALEFRNKRGDARTLYLERGEPVSFDSELDTDRPEDALLYAGLLTKARYNEMRTGPHLSARHACANLVDTGALKSEELFTAVRGVFREQIFSLFEWSEGSFSYREIFAHAADRLRLTKPFNAVLLEGMRRKFHVYALWEALGGPRSIIGPDDRAQSLPAFLEDEVEIARLFDGQRSLEDVVLDTGANEQMVLCTALALISAGAAQILARGVPRGMGERSERVEKNERIDRERIEDRLHTARHGDYFSFLGVSEEATQSDIKHAAARLRERYSPSRFLSPGFADLKGALQEIVEISHDAEDVLVDDDLRARYTERLRKKRETGTFDRRLLPTQMG